MSDSSRASYKREWITRWKDEDICENEKQKWSRSSIDVYLNKLCLVFIPFLIWHSTLNTLAGSPIFNPEKTGKNQRGCNSDADIDGSCVLANESKIHDLFLLKSMSLLYHG